jgi:hypothetical protein
VWSTATAAGRGEAVRTALREAAARRRARSSITAEVQKLAADEGDREEMRIVREQMAELAPGPAELTWSAARYFACLLRARHEAESNEAPSMRWWFKPTSFWR